jgi:CheY-like chemotaxis protein
VKEASKSITILLLENMEDDVFFFRRALASLQFQGQVRVVKSLLEASAYMTGMGRFSDRAYFPLPHFIVCDYGLGGERGTDFVAWLKQQPEFAHIPVVFFSGSVPEKEIPALIQQFGIPIHKKHTDFNDNVSSVKAMLTSLQPPPQSQEQSGERAT